MTHNGSLVTVKKNEIQEMKFHYNRVVSELVSLSSYCDHFTKLK